MSTDIAVLNQNKRGEDFIIGDVHGSAAQLKLALDKLKTDDRLFVVGDLADRGSASLDVYSTIIDANAKREKKGLPPQINVTRGNHEELFLKFYENRKNPFSAEVQHFLSKGVDGVWALKASEDELAKIYNYISSLPYIIRVNGDKPFTVVHADMPLTDEELQDRIDNDQPLSLRERHYAMWARSQDKGEPIISNRTKDSIITYCGHTICDGVRAETNHVNLDVGTYATKQICLVNHHKGTCELITDNTVERDVFSNKKSTKAIEQEINSQLSQYHQHTLQNMVDHIFKSELSAKKLATQIDSLLTAFSDLPRNQSLEEKQTAYHKNKGMVYETILQNPEVAKFYDKALMNGSHFTHTKKTRKFSILHLFKSKITDNSSPMGKTTSGRNGSKERSPFTK